MIPFAFLILGIVVGNSLFSGIDSTNNELMIFGMGILFLAVSLVVVRIIDKVFAKKDESIIVMTRKL